MIPAGWMPHRRADGETVGYIEFLGGEFVPRDLLGRRIANVRDWELAEAAVEELGLAWLAEPQLLDGDPPRRVRVAEVSPARIVLLSDDFGASQAVGAAAPERWEFELPLTVGLRPLGRA